MAATVARRAMEVSSSSPGSASEAELNAKVDQILSRHPAVGFAFGVVRNGELEFFRTHGVADMATMRPVTADTVFRIASITKTFTAIAVMQLWERGLVDLDAPANDYLRAFQLVPARPGFRPASVRHLMTHTAGLAEMVHPSRGLRYAFGESYALGESRPSLGEYYRGGLRVHVEPGTRFAYTDHSFATLGQIVADVSGEPIDMYFRKHIFGPLGMADTDLNRLDRVESRRATGYNMGPHGPRPVTDREWMTAAASSIYSTPKDMARYVAALLGGGANGHGSVLKPATLEMMFGAQYQPHPLVPGIGLAFSRFEIGGHLAVEHEGVLPGFNSDIFLAPHDGVGVMAFTNGARQAMFWLPAEASDMLRYLLGVPPDAIRTDVPQHPELWGEICGWYELEAGVSDTRIRSMVGLGVEVFVSRGSLVFRAMSPIPALLKGFRLHPDDVTDPYVFRVDASQFGMGTARILFSRDPRTGTMRMHLDLMPISLHRVRAGSGPQRGIAAAAGAVALVAAIAVRRRRARWTKGKATARG